MDIDITDRKALASLDRFYAAKALAKRVGKHAPQRLHGRLSHVEWGLPESQDLRQAVAMVAVLVSDEDGVETVNLSANGGEAGERFALSEAGVHKDAGAFSFEQRQIARATGRENGDAQTYGTLPKEM
jgi:hypothetical protein